MTPLRSRLLLVITLVCLGPSGRAEPMAWSSLVEIDAYLAYGTGDFERARERYRSAGGYRGWIGAGSAAYRLGDWAAAQAAFEQALTHARTDSERARASYDLGNALARGGDLSAARRAYERALRWQPEHAHAARNLALITEQQGLLGRRRPSERPDAPVINRSHAKEETTSGRGDAGDSGETRGTRQGNSGHTRTGKEIARAVADWKTIGGQRDDHGARDPLLAEALLRRQALDDDLTAIVRYRIAQEEARRAPLPADLPPW